MSLVSTTSGVAVVDTRVRPGTITLPLTSQIPTRYLQFKDLYGSFGRSSLTLSTQLGDFFDDGTTSKVLTDPFTFFTLYAASTSRWAQLGGTQTIQQTISSLNVSSITIGSGQGFWAPEVSTVAGLGTAGYISSLTLNASLISTTTFISQSFSSFSTAFGPGGGLTTLPLSISTNQLFTSSLLASTVTTRVLSTQQFFTSSILGSSLDVAGTGRFVSLSSQQLFVSSINGQVFGSFSGSTNALSAGTIVASSITTNFVTMSSGITRFNGTASASAYGQGSDTFTLQTNSNSYVGGIASLAFATNTASYPLARIYALDSATSGSPLSQLVFQNVPTSLTSFTSNYSFTGSDQTFIVPTGVTTIQVTLWGAGGGGGLGGGAGAFVKGLLAVSAGQTYRVIVGQGSSGGATRSALMLNTPATISSASGTGSLITYTTNSAHNLQIGQPVIVSGLTPAGFNGTFAVFSLPSGTQFTVVSTQSGSSSGTGAILAEVVDAGSGGGGTLNGRGGAATFSGTAFAAETVPSGGTSGQGGTQTGGGAGGNGGGAGSVLTGGLGVIQGGNGGAGYYGGGGGGWASDRRTGGGGGSSYTSFTGFSLTLGLNSPNSQNQAPGTSESGYVPGIAAGSTGTGGNGLIILNSVGGAITEAMRIGTNGFLGVGTTTPAYLLDVAGNARLSNVYLGTNSTLVTQQFYGLQGNYNNTVLAEISTGGGAQELLVFKGSSSSDRVRVQTTGTFVVETGVSARLWSTNTAITSSNATPAFIINTSSNVGIQTATPGATLDVAGTGRFVTVSTQQVFLSSINGGIPLTALSFTSTVAGLGSSGYISSLTLNASLISTVTGLGTAGYLSTAGGGGGLTTANLTSTVTGLGTAGYLSTAGGGGGEVTTANLTSTVTGIGTNFFINSLGASTIVAGSLSSFSLTVSSFYSATRQATPMFITF